MSVADAWFALAPAVVLVLGDAQTPDWSKWPVYLLALIAQVSFDSAIYAARTWAALGEHPKAVVGEMLDAQRVDVLLFPVGLLVAFGAARSERRASSRRSSSRAPTAAPPCCSAT